MINFLDNYSETSSDSGGRAVYCLECGNWLYSDEFGDFCCEECKDEYQPPSDSDDEPNRCYECHSLNVSYEFDNQWDNGFYCSVECRDACMRRLFGNRPPAPEPLPPIPRDQLLDIAPRDTRRVRILWLQDDSEPYNSYDVNIYTNLWRLDEFGNKYFRDDRGDKYFYDDFGDKYYIDDYGNKTYTDEFGYRYRIDLGRRCYYNRNEDLYYYVDVFGYEYYIDNYGDKYYYDEYTCTYYYEDESGRRFYYDGEDKIYY